MKLIASPESRINALNLLRRLPPVLRARNYYIYVEGNRRLVDLWLYGGKNVLGHKPANMVRELKNSAERGLFTPFPNALEHRFKKALAELLPIESGEAQRTITIFESRESLASALTQCGIDPASIQDPAFGTGKKNDPDVKASFWRPFVGGRTGDQREGFSFVVPIIPCPVAPWVLISDLSLHSDLIPPTVLTPAVRTIYNVLSAKSTRGKIKLPKVEKLLKKEDCVWQRHGIYLCLKQEHRAHQENSNWEKLWLRFLENGFLLPPDPDDPLILPETISPGEEAKLAKLLSELL